MENMHKPNLDKPNVESVAGYRKGQAPDAAKFGVGGDGGAAAEARRRHSAEPSISASGPTLSVAKTLIIAWQ
jgi:hypothetical protein